MHFIWREWNTVANAPGHDGVYVHSSAKNIAMLKNS